MGGRHTEDQQPDITAERAAAQQWHTEPSEILGARGCNPTNRTLPWKNGQED
nr:MAG TPA: hypothetical protein [Caudoviricetes sp.]